MQGAGRDRIGLATGGVGCLAMGAALTSPSPALLAQIALSVGCFHVRIAFAFAFLPSLLPQTPSYASSHPTCGLSNAVETLSASRSVLRPSPSLRPESPSSPAPVPRTRQGDVHYHGRPSSSHCCALSHINRLACSPPHRRPSRHQLLQEPSPALYPARRRFT